MFTLLLQQTTAVADNPMKIIGGGIFKDFLNCNLNLLAVVYAFQQLHAPFFMNILGDSSGRNAKLFRRLRLGQPRFHQFNSKISPDLRKMIPYGFFTRKYHNNTFLRLTGIAFSTSGQ